MKEASDIGNAFYILSIFTIISIIVVILPVSSSSSTRSKWTMCSNWANVLSYIVACAENILIFFVFLIANSFMVNLCDIKFHFEHTVFSSTTLSPSG